MPPRPSQCPKQDHRNLTLIWRRMELVPLEPIQAGVQVFGEARRELEVLPSLRPWLRASGSSTDQPWPHKATGSRSQLAAVAAPAVHQDRHAHSWTALPAGSHWAESCLPLVARNGDPLE